MWLKDDLEQLKQNWKQSPWWVRLWMVVSLFLAISSLASLSEAVANWRGFFLDTIEFYRAWISGPLREVAAAHGLRYTSDIADFLVLQAIIISVYIRALALDADWSMKSEKRFFWIVTWFMAGILCILIYSAANTITPLPGWCVLLLTVGWFIVPVLLAKKMKFARIFLMQIAIVVVAVSVLGAISNGLSAVP